MVERGPTEKMASGQRGKGVGCGGFWMKSNPDKGNNKRKGSGVGMCPPNATNSKEASGGVE